ncbi:MAG: type II toxin-antitoxin system MqsR family toxin [Betaproteobacteria bacterium]|nr:type II toxin-antitoxin system MqsR family toxin [Betaproteobacteria bacterium]
MEKHKPHYPLDAIKAEVIRLGMVCFTHSAIKGASLLGLSEAEAVSVVLGLEQRMFFKSMTTHSDNRVWQDVYHTICPNGLSAYIKLTLRVSGSVVIQFKEK